MTAKKPPPYLFVYFYDGGPRAIRSLDHGWFVLNERIVARDLSAVEAVRLAHELSKKEPAR